MNNNHDADAIARGETTPVETDFNAVFSPVEPEPEPAPIFTTPEVVEEVYIPDRFEAPVVEPEIVETPVAVEPEPVVVKAKSKKIPQPETVIAYEDDEVVLLSSLILNGYARNSRSVWLVQERLINLGYTDAGTDEQGWLSEGTRSALAEFCGCSVEECKVNCKDTITRLFEGTPVQVKD